MFAGFDPGRAPAPYLERRRGRALAVALLVHVVLAATVVWLEVTRESSETVEVALDEPTIENIDIVEEPEEPEPEPEPEIRPKPPDIRNVTKQTEKAVESDIAQERAPEPDSGPTPPPAAKPEKAEAPPPEKPRARKVDIGDRETARPMPAEGKPPKPEAGNKAPTYPETLRKQNVTGVIKVKLDIHLDGSVRGMKVLQKSVSGTDDPVFQEQAKKHFLKAVVATVQTWKFQPATLKGKTISVWWPVTIPFNLN